jgi:hypothetical protein
MRSSPAAPSSLAVHGESDRYYKASITTAPSPVVGGVTDVAFAVKITNCALNDCDSDHYSGTNQAIKSANVVVPAGLTNITSLSVAVSNGGTWDTPVLDGNTLKTDKGGGSDQLAPGQWVEITFHADVPCDPAVFEFQTAAFNADDNLTTPYTLFPVTAPVSYPTITVTATTCGGDETTECPAAPAIAAHYLHDHGVRPGSSAYSNIVAAVAAHMGPTTDFDGIAKCDSGYASAVEAFVQNLIDQLP